MLQTFNNKWSDIIDNQKKEKDEKSLFVDIGQEPQTQRELNLYNYFKFIQNILKKRKSNQKIFEAGCGRGTMSLYLSKYLNCKMYLMDKEQDAVNIAKKLFQENNQDAKFYTGDVLNTKFEDNKFDVVISIGLAEHFKTLDVFFKEQLRILKPGGIIISLNIPKKFSIQFLNSVMRFFKKIVGLYKDSVNSDYYRNSYSYKEYAQSVSRVGFQDISVVHVCPFPIYTPIKFSTDKKIASVNKFILKIRSIFQKYPYKTNSIIAQAHFLVAKKK